MLFNLYELIVANTDLSTIEADFTKDEIDAVISQLPRGKSPSPDGFNKFIKSCWSIIANDFYDLIRNFLQERLCIRSINASNITLIPKSEGANKVNDFRPISLLNTSMMVITKLLEHRLQGIIPKLMHKNQYGFIKKRTIQDCLTRAL